MPSRPTPFNVPRRRRGAAFIEFALLMALFAAEGSWLPPDPNEAYYLSNALHHWDPSWCPRDFFLNSAYSHWSFYAAFGWLTKVMPLEQAAWCGRGLTW